MTNRNPIVMCDLAAQRARLEPGLSQAIQRVLDHGQFILGPEVAQLEEELARFCGAHHVVTCANGTDAIELVLKAENIGPGDAVVVPSFTFVATAEAVANAGATPIFADVELDTFSINPESAERCIALARLNGLSPRAIVAVDLFGLPADYLSLDRIAKKHDLLLIADAAQSFGARSPMGAVGTLADYTTTSFFPSKPLGCYGDGGAIFTNCPVKSEVLRSLRSHGKGADKYDNIRLGMNSRLDTVQAAILLEKLRIFEEELQTRERVAVRYSALLQSSVRLPVSPAQSFSSWAQFTIQCGDEQQREQIQSAMNEAAVSTAVYYPKAIHEQIPFLSCPCDSEGLPNSLALCKIVLSLPIHAYLDDRHLAHVSEVILSVVT